MSRFLPIVFLGIALGLFFGYIHPTVTGSIAATQKEISQYDKALAAATRFDQKQTQLATDMQALPQDGIARLERFLPNTVNNVQLILDLDGLASRSGLKITAFSDAQTEAAAKSSSVDVAGALVPTVDQPYESLDLSISATGSYAQLRAFLDGVEASLQPLDLVELKITDSATGVYTYSMTFRLYWLR